MDMDIWKDIDVERDRTTLVLMCILRYVTRWQKRSKSLSPKFLDDYF